MADDRRALDLTLTFRVAFGVELGRGLQFGELAVTFYKTLSCDVVEDMVC